MTNYVSIGKLVAAFGVNGEMVLRHSLGRKTSLRGLGHLFLEQGKDEFLPYFIQAAKSRSDTEILLTLEGVTNREAAIRLLQKEVWLEDEAFHQYAGKSAPISLLGFHIVDGENDLGEVLEVIEQPHQVLCRILLDGKEALIPLHEGTLVKIDRKNRKVMVELPDGLLEIFR